MSILGRVSRYALMASMMVVLVLTLGACSSVPPSNTAGLPRLDVVPGQLLIVPLTPEEARSARGQFTAWLDTGSSITVSTHEVFVSVVEDPTSEQASRWLPAAGVWSSLEKRSRSDTLTVLALQVPPSEGARTPKVVRVLGRDYALQFLPRSVDLMTSGASDTAQAVPGDPWSPTVGSAGAVSPILTAIAWPEAISPIGRWRFRMMSGTLNPVYESPPFEDRIIEALAIQNDSRWRSALAKLWAIDPDLTVRLKGRLAGVVDFGNGYVAPAWPTDHAAIDRLLSDILDPLITKQQVCNRVEGWLLLQPRAIAWVADDAGQTSVDGRGIGTVGVANLGGLSTLAWISSPVAEATDLTPLPAFSAARLSVDPPSPGASNTPESRGVNGSANRAMLRVGVHAGTWKTDVALVDGTVPVRVPGFRIGPLFGDYTMATWLAGVTPKGPAMPTAAMLLPVASPNSSSAAVELLVECMAPGVASNSSPSMDSAASSADVVRIWIGPLGAPRAVFRVDATGAIADEARRPDLVKTPGDVRIVRTADRWSFRLSIPAECVEPSGIIRLGLTRTDASGARAAWPRPMLPWQDEPGRLALKTDMAK